MSEKRSSKQISKANLESTKEETHEEVQEKVKSSTSIKDIEEPIDQEKPSENEDLPQENKEEILETPPERTENEIQVPPLSTTKADRFKTYLASTKLSSSFRQIFEEILTKKIPKEKVFGYTALRLRQMEKEMHDSES